MSKQFLNPITMSFNLLARYKFLLHDTLQQHGLSEADIQTILANMTVDQGLFFSLNPKFATSSKSFEQFCSDHGLSPTLPDVFPNIYSLYRHQEQAIQAILQEQTTIISTGTGSGKTESFLIPIIDYCLKHSEPGIKAVIIYPMNALANDQMRRIAGATAEKELTFGSYTGVTPRNEAEEFVKPLTPNHLVYREQMQRTPPAILLTNYVMLEWMLTRGRDRAMFLRSATTLKYIVLDEIHTYRGNKATHLKYLLRRLKGLVNANVIQIGASATLSKHRGYLADHEGEARPDPFITTLLDVNDYAYITPIPEPEPAINPAPCPQFAEQQNLGWALELDNQTGLKNLSVLTGKQYPEVGDFGCDDFERSQPFQDLNWSAFVQRLFQDLNQSAFVQRMKQKLSQAGTHSFRELTQLLIPLLPNTEAALFAEEIVKAYLSACAFINHLSKHMPILDFRIHLFLRDIGGHLKKCLKCTTFHSGRQEFCPECGFPLFYVYRGNIRQCIGKVTNNRLKYEPRTESDDKKMRIMC